MPFLCVGRSVIKEGVVVSHVDLVLAVFGVFFGLLALAYPGSFFETWDVFSYGFKIPAEMESSGLLTTCLTIILLFIFILEILLFIIFTTAIRQLSERRLDIWYKCRFSFLILTVVLAIYRTIDMRNGPQDVLIVKGVTAIILLLYKGYGLLIITFFEELILRNDNLAKRNNYFKL